MGATRKRIDALEIRGVGPSEEWQRLQGLREALPPGVNVPDEKLYHVTVSGSLDEPRHEAKHGVVGNVVSAWDVFRHDPKDAPYIFNKDHYFVLRTQVQGGYEYWLHGPFRKGEPDHWLEEIPDEYSACEVLVSRNGKGTE
jgi:hypothetical protein